MFSKPQIRDLLNRYVLVQLYTDQVPPRFRPTTTAAENRKFQAERFGNAQLPLYAILRPVAGQQKFQEVAHYDEGKINNEPAFMRFLERPFAPPVADSQRLANIGESARLP